MLSSLRRLRLLLDRRAAIQFGVMLGAIVVMALLQITGVAAILPFMQLVAEPERIETDARLASIYASIGFTSPREMLIWLGVVVLLIFAAATLFAAFTSWLIQRCVWSMAHRICMRLLRNYATLPYAFHLRHNSSDLTKKVLVDVGDLVTGVLLAGSQFVAQIVLSLLLFALMLAVRPTVALVAFGALAGAYGGFHLLSYAYLRRLGRERLEASYGRLSTFTEAMTGVKAIRVEGAAPFFARRFERTSKQFSELQPRYQLMRLTPGFLIELLAFGGLVVVVLFLLSAGQDLLNIVPSLIFFALAAYKLLPALNRAFQCAAQLSHHLPAVDEVVRDLQEVSSEPSLEAFEDDDPAASIAFDHAVRLQGVSFAYDESRDVLSDVDLVIEKKKSVALIGSTGSGKTTLVDIIIGLLPPSAGTLTVDDTEITPATAVPWRRKIAYVPQDIFLYDDTITKNIAFGIEADAIDMNRVREAAQIAQLDDFVSSELPDGYETVIGERGVRLSGGQRQRIGLARAFYRSPELLILDEATSALDGITEQAVMAAIRASIPDVTLLMIAHRLSTVRLCEQLHLVEEGRIVASGTFEELRAKNAVVRDMAQSTS